MTELNRQVERHAGRAPGAVAYREITNGRTLTYAGLATAVGELAGQIRRTVAGGSTVVIRVANTCDYPVAFLATLAAGCAAFPVPADIAAPEFAAAVERAAAVIGPGLNVEPTMRRCAESRHGLLLQSSGTTGRPKVVYRDAAAVDAVSANMVKAIGFGSDDVVLATVPLCHSYGLEHGLLAPLSAGAGVHLCQGFDLHLVLRELGSGGVTIFPAVPSMFEMLAQLGGDDLKFASLRLTYSAGGPLPASIADAFVKKYGLKIAQLYGASEIGSVTFTRPGDATFDPRSVGRAMDGVSIRLSESEGEILVRATSMFAGYLGGESGLTPDGYFPTGDLGRLDAHGNLTVTGRIKLLIDVGGLKVNPLEVEDVLCRHPAVAACVVVPVRLSETISRVKAVVRAVDPARPPAAEELRKFARARLTPHKVPRVFEFRDVLPLSPTGKILRHLVETA